MNDSGASTNTNAFDFSAVKTGIESVLGVFTANLTVAWNCCCSLFNSLLVLLGSKKRYCNVTKCVLWTWFPCIATNLS